MNIDKFGHHVHKRLRTNEISELKYKALLRTEAGHFDLQNLRLKGVPEPLSPDDVVNKQYVDKYIQNMCEKKYIDSMFDTINSKIHHLATQLRLNFYTNKEIDSILRAMNDDKRTNSERNSSIGAKEL